MDRISSEEPAGESTARTNLISNERASVARINSIMDSIINAFVTRCTCVRL